ncbi:hypothetical protein WMY93_033267 [Mugilogobius chulae]|uniref:Gypsy retrotransposon integrase-like protein 1 n=1 Tax=Mugilogobius chulae TaxID=88201 RepID=A0AAW0MIF3_9GOBI
MNTRHGKVQTEEGPCSTTIDQQGAKASAPKDRMEELAGMMKYLNDSQNTRDKKAETERTQQEQRWKSVQDQVNQLQQQLSRVQAERSAHPERVSQPVQVTLEGPTEDDDYEDYGPRYPYRPHREPKLLPLAPDDDIEHFLTTFERMAQVCRWPDEEWAVRLVPLLTGKARSAYVVMDMKDAEDYDKVKDAILAKYEITSETYRRRFRSLHIEPNETPRELYVRLKELFTRWIQPEKTTIKKMSEKLILEQFLRMVTPELEVWIKEHDPDTAEEAARLAEVFMSARRGTRSSYFGREPRQPMPSNDIPTLPDLIVQADVAHPERVVEPVVEPLVQCTPESAKPCNVLTRAQIARGVFEELPFCDEELETQPYIGALQKEDATLKPWFDKVKEQEGIKTGKGSCLDEASYVVKNGLLYQVKDKNEALALPEKLRVQVMELGHAVPWAGHMAVQKTLRRIGSRFAWPGMFSQVSKFCSSCKVCQLTSNKGVARAHLQPLPIIGTPFERIGMDIVGPLERSSAGNRYILVLSDYATRYPEAFPLRSIKAKQIANCLLQLFSRVGVVKEILTDCGTNFLSKLLQQVYQLLGVKGIRTTPYHPQTDGLVERYNQTLKSMLRKFVSTTGKDWDQWLSYLLFAYREVPQASTGFSPFELLYGRQVRGPLDLLKDHWERTEPEGDNIVAYVLKMRERLQAMAAMAQENLKAAQTSQKTWYDQKAKNRTFTPGQKVLLLLPTSENKLLAKWHGPYEITKQVSNVTYELFMPERLKKHQVFHINLLKEFIVRQEPSQQFLVRAVKDEEQDELKPLLNADLFQETPGFTSLVQHQIRLKQDAPKRQRSYRIPERLVPVLKKEIELMLELGIIEISDSEWCSPVVLVPKKDGSLRFCINFRYLNAISNFDPYPMPRIDELLERVGSAAYITTLDLSRGYCSWHSHQRQEN